MSENTDPELARARVLLAPQNTGVDLEEAAPLTTAADIGARDGIGFEASRPDVHVDIYVFDSQSEHQAAIDKLEALAPSGDSYVLHTSNGALLFFGYADTSGDSGDAVDAEERLDALIQAFAGEE